LFLFIKLGTKDFVKMWPFKKNDEPSRSADEEVTETAFIEKGLSLSKSQSLFALIHDRELFPRLPDLQDGRVVHIACGITSLTKGLKEKGAQQLYCGFVGRTPVEAIPAQDEVFSFKSAMDRLPLQSGSFKTVIISEPARPATPIASLIKEVGRILKSGGEGVLLDWHPYNPIVKAVLHSKPVVDESEGIGFEKYFRSLNQAGLRLTKIKESFVDGNFRQQLKGQEETLWYEKNRREPYALLIFFKKD
jgi:SAM-dependent methyltransferase